jgi:hypothetical protein
VWPAHVRPVQARPPEARNASGGPHRRGRGDRLCGVRCGRPLDGAMEGGRVLAPEVVGRRGQIIEGVVVEKAGGASASAAGRSDGDELLARAEPVTRKAHDILIRGELPVARTRLPTIRFHGVLQTFLVSRDEYVSRGE